jgi:GR25 family glycosyltransferase involved in LPS biosynthesis
MKKIDINKIKKFVINLDKRTDRLEHFKKEMEWMGWEFERFNAIDTSSYVGCAKSFQEIGKICMNLQDEYFMIMEDDIFFMPYSKEQLKRCEDELNNMTFDLFHLSPSLHRPVNNISENLIDLSNLPIKDENKHREVFGLSALIVNKKVCEYLINWDTDKYMINKHQQLSIDEYVAKVIYPNTISISSSLPVVSQIMGHSDINGEVYNPHYIITYNWNVYTENKIDERLFDLGYAKNLRL